MEPVASEVASITRAVHGVLERVRAARAGARRFDGAEAVPRDVRGTGQMNAEAVTRVAQVFLDAPAPRRTGARRASPCPRSW